MKKLIVSLLIAILILSLYAAVGKAEEPKHTVTVTVDDITAVSAQIIEYEDEMDMLARLVWAEARGIDSEMEQAAVAWCVLNRVDAGYGTISEVVTAKHQFAYRKNAPVTEELRELAKDVLTRWLLEKRGVIDVGRVLPTNYLYFAGRRGHNRFRISYRGRTYWDWSLMNPYEVANE